MSKPLVIKILSLVVSVIVCLLMATSVLAQQDFWGIGDLKALLIWQLPLAVGLATGGEAILRLLNAFQFYLRAFFVLLCSVVLVVCWVYTVYLFLGLWTNAFSFPVFYLWLAGCVAQFLFLDWMLPKASSLENATTLLKELAWFPVAIVSTSTLIYLGSMAMSYVNRPHKELYLIPKGYQGQFRVVDGEKGGLESEFEEGRRVIHVPQEGVVVIPPRFEEGEIDHRYFMVDESGKREELASIDSPSPSLPRIELAGSGSMASEEGNENSGPIYYTDLSVSYPNVPWDDRAYTVQQWRLDSLMLIQVKKCRSSLNKKERGKE